jgi:hypothetical protein
MVEGLWGHKKNGRGTLLIAEKILVLIAFSVFGMPDESVADLQSVREDILADIAS